MRRQLTVVESAGLTFGRIYANIFAMNAHVKGEITVSEVRFSIDKVCQKYPFLAAHVVTDEGIEWYETAGTEPIPVNLLERDWSEAIVAYLNMPFDNRTSPQLRILLRSYNGYSDLVLMIDHSIADGLSGSFVLRDILHYIAHPDGVVIPIEYRPSLDQLLPPYNIEEAASLPDASGEVTSSEPASSRTLFIVPWSLSEADTTALLVQCRRHEVTVHSALCTAFLNIYARLDPSGRTLRSVSSPVSVRNCLTQPVGEQVGNYINSGVRISLDCTPERAFWEMAHEFNAALAAGTDNDSLLISIVKFHNMIRGWYQSVVPLTIPESGGRADYDFSLSNLGYLDFPKNYGWLELECIYGPILNSFIDETIIGVATAGGRLTFSLVSRLRLMNYADALRIREQFMTMLNELPST
jgi:hypothetical protein